VDTKTTLNQLTLSDNGYGRLVAMIGAKNFVKHTEDNGDSWVSFKFMKGAKNKANYMKITLNGSDLYNVEMGKIWGHKYTVIDTTDNMFAEDLFNHFQTETQLALKL